MERGEETLEQTSDIFSNKILKKQKEMFCKYCLGNFSVNTTVNNCVQCARRRCRKRVLYLM